jgi:hypothetical protein
MSSQYVRHGWKAYADYDRPTTASVLSIPRTKSAN